MITVVLRDNRVGGEVEERGRRRGGWHEGEAVTGPELGTEVGTGRKDGAVGRARKEVGKEMGDRKVEREDVEKEVDRGQGGPQNILAFNFGVDAMLRAIQERATKARYARTLRRTFVTEKRAISLKHFAALSVNCRKNWIGTLPWLISIRCLMGSS